MEVNLNIPKPILQKIIQCIIVGILGIAISVAIIQHKNSQTNPSPQPAATSQTETTAK